MSDPLRLFWLFSIGVVAQRRSRDGPPALAAMEDGFAVGEAGLLLDRRLVKARGRHVTSFISGLVASFLPPLMLFLGSVVLSAVPVDTLELFMGLLRQALPAVCRSKLLFRLGSPGTPSPLSFLWRHYQCMHTQKSRVRVAKLRRVGAFANRPSSVGRARGF